MDFVKYWKSLPEVNVVWMSKIAVLFPLYDRGTKQVFCFRTRCWQRWKLWGGLPSEIIFEKKKNIQRQSYFMPSNFKENTIDFSENISSHLEQIIDTGIRNFWKFPANTIFIRANAVFGYFFFEQILTANVKKSDSCYNVFIMVSVCLSCLLKLFLAHAPRRFGPASH